MSLACQPSLRYGAFDREAGSPGFDDERRNAVVGSRGDSDDRRDRCARVRDERLRAVDHPVVSFSPGACARGAGVTSGVGLSETEGAERSAGDEVGQPSLLLIVGAEAEDRVGTETDTGGQGDAHRLVDSADLFDRDAERGEVAVTPAPLGGEDQAEQAEVAHRLHRFEGKHVILVPLGGVRGDLALCEISYDLAEGFVFRRQVEIHHPSSEVGAGSMTAKS